MHGSNISSSPPPQARNWFIETDRGPIVFGWESSVEFVWVDWQESVIFSCNGNEGKPLSRNQFIRNQCKLVEFVFHRWSRKSRTGCLQSERASGVFRQQIKPVYEPVLISTVLSANCPRQSRASCLWLGIVCGICVIWLASECYSCFQW